MISVSRLDVAPQFHTAELPEGRNFGVSRTDVPFGVVRVIRSGFQFCDSDSPCDPKGAAYGNTSSLYGSQSPAARRPKLVQYYDESRGNTTRCKRMTTATITRLSRSVASLQFLARSRQECRFGVANQLISLD